jgi:hypothetical protein
VESAQASSAAQLRWEQRVLPAAARELAVDIIHMPHLFAPFLSSVPILASPTDNLAQTRRESGVSPRLRGALRAGSQTRLAGILWPEDISVPDESLPWLSLPPVVHPDFGSPFSNHPTSEPDVELPESYILYHGPYDMDSLQTMLSAWTWGAGSIGAYFPMVLVGMDQAERALLATLRADYGLGESVIDLNPFSPTSLPTVYQRCSALFHPASEPPWGGPVRRALACGKPIIAAQEPNSAEIVGPAAYLVPKFETKKLGAALITVVVEEEVSGELSKAALARSAGWNQGQLYGNRLVEIYHQICGHSFITP